MSELQPAKSAAGKWTVALTVLFGVFMAVMDVTVVNVALPHMMGAFGVNQTTITWVATGYAIAQLIMLSMAGWLSTLLGRKRLYLLSFLVFTIGSMLAGTSQTFGQMILWRTLQGLGGGALIPVSLAIMIESFPQEQRGMAMAIYGMGVVLAPAVGPVLGGWLIDNYGWPWIFYINVPVSLLGMLLIAAFVHDPPYLRRGLISTDWLGVLLLAVGLTTLQVVLEKGNEENWFESSWIVIGSVVTVVSLAALAVLEVRSREPVINVRLLRNVALAVTSAMGIVFGVALFGTTFILPQFTQTLLGYPAFTSGMVLMPRAAAVFVMMPIVGYLYKRIDGRVLVLVGLLMMAFTYYQLAHLTLYVAPSNLVRTLVLMGAGMPFMFVTLSAISVNGIARADMTQASSIYTLFRTVGGNIGYALTATLVANSTQANRSMMVKHINNANPVYLNFHAAATAGLTARGLNPVAAAQAANSLVDSMVNQQATMLAYNQTSLIMGLLLVAILPLLLFLPGRRAGRRVRAAGGVEAESMLFVARCSLFECVLRSRPVRQSLLKSQRGCIEQRTTSNEQRFLTLLPQPHFDATMPATMLFPCPGLCMKLGAHIYLWTDRWSDASLPLLDKAAALGLDYVELAAGDDVHFAPELTRRRAEALGLELVMSPGGLWPVDCDIVEPRAVAPPQGRDLAQGHPGSLQRTRRRGLCRRHLWPRGHRGPQPPAARVPRLGG